MLSLQRDRDVEIAADLADGADLDLVVPGDCRRFTVGSVHINGVAATFTMNVAAVTCKVILQIATLHNADFEGR